MGGWFGGRPEADLCQAQKLIPVALVATTCQPTMPKAESSTVANADRVWAIGQDQEIQPVDLGGRHISIRPHLAVDRRCRRKLSTTTRLIKNSRIGNASKTHQRNTFICHSLETTSIETNTVYVKLVVVRMCHMHS